MARIIHGVGGASSTCHYKHQSRGVICGQTWVMATIHLVIEETKGPHKNEFMCPSHDGVFSKHSFIK